MFRCTVATDAAARGRACSWPSRKFRDGCARVTPSKRATLAVMEAFHLMAVATIGMTGPSNLLHGPAD